MAIAVCFLECLVAPVYEDVDLVPLGSFVFLDHVLLVKHFVHEVAEAEEDDVGIVVGLDSRFDGGAVIGFVILFGFF